MRIAFFSFALMLGCLFQVKSQSLIQGQITDSNGSPVSGAIVHVNGTFLAISSDAKGNYMLRNSSESEIVIEVSMLGFITSSKRITPSKETKLDFILQPKVFIADEVVISATRAGDKSAMAFTTLSKKEIADQNLGQDMPMLLQYPPRPSSLAVPYFPSPNLKPDIHSRSSSGVNNLLLTA